MENSGKILYNGIYTTKIEGKMRVSVPKDLRDAIERNNPVPDGHNFEIYVGLGEIMGPQSRMNCLFLYGADEWESMIDKIIQLSPFDSERIFFSSAKKIAVDHLGRVNLGKEFADHMELKKGTGLVYIGNLDKIVLMNPALVP